MKYLLREITSKSEWEQQIALRQEANFLQSWNWGEFQSKLGKKALRYQVVQEDGVEAEALFSLIKEEAKRGTYLALPGGPLMDWNNNDLLMFVFDSLEKIGKEQDADFIRFRPQELDSQAITRQLTGVNARPAQMHLTADLTLQLDLTKPTDQLLSEMRKNHRSAIRKAEKLGIEIRVSKNPDDIREFYEIQLQLAEHHGFVPFGYDFLHEQFLAFAYDDQVELVSSYHENQLLASSFIIYYNKEAVYHYGVSTMANRKLPGSYASQWAAIQAAQQRGCNSYNFWGIAPHDAPEHRFAGVSLFKRGFGGTEVQYVPAHDIPLSAKYTATAAFEFLRKKIRRL